VMVTHDSRSERFVSAVYRLEKGLFVGTDVGGANSRPARAVRVEA
jgi:hypothetical protein